MTILQTHGGWCRPSRISLIATLVLFVGCGNGGETGDSSAGEDSGGSAQTGGAGGTQTGGAGGTQTGGSGGTQTGGSGGNGSGGTPNDSGGSGGGSGGGGTSQTLPLDEVHRGGFCSEGWCWSTPLPQGNAIRTMWSGEGAGVWAGTDGSGVLRWNGSSWDRLDLAGDGAVQIWGSGPDNIYVAVGTALSHVVDDTVTRVNQPELTETIASLSGTGPDDVWVGITGGLHFDGTSWSRPTGFPTDQKPRHMRSAAPDQVWFILGVALGDRHLGFWNGSEFSVVVPNVATEVFSTSADDIWYSDGSDVYRGNERDGFELLADSGTPGVLFGSGTDNIYSLTAQRLRHFDGDAWTDVSTNFGPIDQWAGTSYQKGEVWTGGRYGQLFRTTDGSELVSTPVGEMQLSTPVTNIWSDGTRTYATNFGLYELDDSGPTDNWKNVTLDGQENTVGPQALWGSSPTDIWLVGAGDQIFHFDGTTAELVPDDPTGPSTSWRAIHGASDSDIWVVGDNGIARHYDGTDWTYVTTSSSTDTDDVWVAPDGNAWSVGASGTVMRYTPGAGWADVEEVALPSVQWTAVTGTSSSDVWIASFHDQVYHFDGVEWSKDPGSGIASGRINKLVALAPDDIWGAADFGHLIHYDGTSWREIRTKIDSNLLGLWIGANGESWVSGDYGTILHHPNL